ncbi:hypothetical protein ECH_0674 [Ehrlichia chaffeensis str. Arkansas]|uniref:Uncharacterized protein n=1 Tax=Ehrlichia chaffeensis (strain ATCC CRL-10679 / Arkansas) TaxID=205920 RepID=Q2GGF2_EHRCR|nr:hypothetical protein ECH_0674 [Ehrlichia chaffeensis str. Arkansas]
MFAITMHMHILTFLAKLLYVLLITDKQNIY